MAEPQPSHSERDPQAFNGLRHGREGVSEIEGSVWYGPGDGPWPDSKIYLYIKGAGTFNIDDLPRVIEEARRERGLTDG